MDPEQAQEHSEEFSGDDLAKIEALLDESGNIPEHSEAHDPPEEEEAQAESKAAPEKQPEPAKPQEPESKDQTELVEVEHENGQKYKVPAALKDAFLRQADYTRKTQDVAKDRAAAQQERQVLQRLTQQAAQAPDFIAAMKHVDGQLNQFQNVNWQQLYATDRQQYVELRQAYTELTQTRQNLIGQYQQFQQEFSALALHKHQEALQSGLAEVRKAIPDFGPEHQKALADVAHSLGFKPEETQTILDPRFVIGLNELKTLRAQVAEYQAKEAAATKQVKAAPRMVKPEAKPDPQTSAPRNEALARLRKTGSDDDAVAAIQNLLG